MNNNEPNGYEADSTVTERKAAGPVAASAMVDVPAGDHLPATGDAARDEQAGQDEHEEDLEADAPRRPTRKRPKPGERRLQILQTLAEMLETPKGERITTAALAARLKVSEAALYRHFASKAQMFEGLIEFIESTLFGLINQITTHEEDGFKQLRQMLTMLLSFAERNPGMTRVIIGDALVTEDDRLQARINQLIDRLELSIKQSFRTAVAQGRLPQETDPGARANLLLSYVQGRWLRFAKGGFKRSPMEGLEAQVLLLIM
jgi:TetR/AcrR family transcriptional regulator